MDQVWKIDTDESWSITIEKSSVLRKCRFRPKSIKWNAIAIIDDNVEIYLVYFSGTGEYDIALARDFID